MIGKKWQRAGMPWGCVTVHGAEANPQWLSQRRAFWRDFHVSCLRWVSRAGGTEALGSWGPSLLFLPALTLCLHPGYLKMADLPLASPYTPSSKRKKEVPVRPVLGKQNFRRIPQHIFLDSLWKDLDHMTSEWPEKCSFEICLGALWRK